MQSRSFHTLVIRLSAVALFGSILSLARADLVGWWPLDGTVNEGSGRGLNGTEIGTPTFVDPRPGLSGKAIRFPEGDAHGVSLEPNLALDAEVFTLGYFINLDGIAQGNAGLERLTSRSSYLFETAVGNANAVGGTTSPTGITLSYYQGGWRVTHVPVPDTGWIHVAWQNTASEMTLYVDGVPVYVGPAVPSGRITGLMTIGIAFNTATEGFEGMMDDVFLWNDAENPLSSEDIADIAANGLASHLGLDVDTDGDGLPDVWETRYNLDPADNGTVNPINGAQGDPDADGSRNGVELTDGTDPRDDDTDDDGLKDGAEVAAGGNPTRADTDSDGLNDGAEVTAGTGLNDPDSDDDGFQDGFEVANGSNPLNPASVPGINALLILHLNFDDSVNDVTGHGHDGTLLGTAGFSENVPAALGTGKSLSLAAGETDGVAIAAAPELNSNPFTLAYYFNLNNAFQGNAGLERLTSRGGDAFETAVGDAHAIGLTTSPSGITLSYYQGRWNRTDVEIPPDGWVHAAWRNQAAGMDLFIDGQLVYSGPAVAPTGPTGLLNIGIRHNSNSEGFEGLMDDVRLYAAALSDDDIAAIARGETGGGGLSITDLERNAQTRAVSITWTSQPGRVYTVEYSTNLKTWTILSDSHISGGATTIYTDTTPGVNDNVRFYRVHQN